MTDQAMLQARVTRKVCEASDIYSLELAAAQDAPLPPFDAGAHIDVHLPGGFVRQYSLSNHPRERHRYVISVLRDPASRGGSVAACDVVGEGDILSISAPRNHFPLVQGAQRSVLLGGGIGITPLLCMAEQLADAGADFALHYCTRSRSRTAFYDRLREAAYADKVGMYFDDDPGAGKVDIPALLASPAPGTHLYTCGPAGFLDFVTATARAQGWADDHVHVEHFSGQAASVEGDTPFQVRIASSGAVIDVGAAETVVQALTAHGIEISVSCEQGVCGSCLTRVLEGTPEHRDQVLSEAEHAANDQFLPCCSRSRSPLLVLDL